MKLSSRVALQLCRYALNFSFALVEQPDVFDTWEQASQFWAVPLRWSQWEDVHRSEGCEFSAGNPVAMKPISLAVLIDQALKRNQMKRR